MWSTIIVLQVAAPRKFFAREKSIAAFKRLIRTGWDEMEVFDKCEAAFVVRALCIHPDISSGKGRNMLNDIHDRLGQYIQNTGPISPDELINFSFGIGALCINDYSIDRFLVNKLLDMQHPDGSFGVGSETYRTTLWLLRPLFCLSRMSFSHFNVTRVQESVKKLRSYVLNLLNNANKYPEIKAFDFFAHDALVALWKSRPDNENSSRWYCNEVIKNIRVAPSDSDTEEDLNRKLLTLTGTDYLDLQDSSYACLSASELDKKPKGYKPTCNYEIPKTCGLPAPPKYL
ncbi:uncharacterized protein LOC120348464 [Styela clava]